MPLSCAFTRLKRRYALILLAAGVCLSMTVQAQSRDASQPLRIFVGYPAGATSDIAARLLADGLAARMKLPVIVENRPGAGGRLVARQFRSVRDNNSMMLGNPAVMLVGPMVYSNVGYDTDRDFTPLSRIIDYDFALVVAPQLPVHDLDGLLAWLRENPDSANIGVPGAGGLPHFFALMLADQADAEVEVVAYNSSAQLAGDLMGGRIPVAVNTSDAVSDYHHAGKLRILATSGTERNSLIPQVPTFRQTGLELDASGWNVLYAPASMPPERTAELATAVYEVMQDEALRQRFEQARLEPVGATQEQTLESLQAFEAQWRPAIESSGFKP